MNIERRLKARHLSQIFSRNLKITSSIQPLVCCPLLVLSTPQGTWKTYIQKLSGMLHQSRHHYVMAQYITKHSCMYFNSWAMQMMSCSFLRPWKYFSLPLIITFPLNSSSILHLLWGESQWGSRPSEQPVWNLIFLQRTTSCSAVSTLLHGAEHSKRSVMLRASEWTNKPEGQHRD